MSSYHLEFRRILEFRKSINIIHRSRSGAVRGHARGAGEPRGQRPPVGRRRGRLRRHTLVRAARRLQQEEDDAGAVICCMDCMLLYN